MYFLFVGKYFAKVITSSLSNVSFLGAFCLHLRLISVGENLQPTCFLFEFGFEIFSKVWSIVIMNILLQNTNNISNAELPFGVLFVPKGSNFTVVKKTNGYFLLLFQYDATCVLYSFSAAIFNFVSNTSYVFNSIVINSYSVRFRFFCNACQQI